VLGLSALVEGGVEFVVVGVGGINFYARSPAQAFATLDLDVLLEPRVPNLRAALRALSGRGYRFEAGGEPFLDVDDETVLGRIVSRGASLSARHEDAGQLDLMLSISGFTYAELSRDARSFRVGGLEVRVGRLEKLLRSKQESGRPKDLEFLRAFEARGGEEEGGKG
jgi:hypothetical protein